MLAAALLCALTWLEPACAQPASAPAAAASAAHGRPTLKPEYAAAAAAIKKPVKVYKLVDINSASKAELIKLPGIGDTEAAKIIANRPYLSKAELVSKNVLLTGPYMSIRYHIQALTSKAQLQALKAAAAAKAAASAPAHKP